MEKQKPCKCETPGNVVPTEDFIHCELCGRKYGTKELTPEQKCAYCAGGTNEDVTKSVHYSLSCKPPIKHNHQWQFAERRYFTKDSVEVVGINCDETRLLFVCECGASKIVKEKGE